ncbi:MAG TPA: HAMP domain-containing sensor histidine kinase [Acidimicrobiia bacterium]|nr:HAMP domain-containing sensor histidine kinase [Acidimicrobiia bacterium]
MTRRITTAIVSVVIVVVVLFGTPLAIAVRRLYHDSELDKLERKAAAATRQVPDSVLTHHAPIRLRAPHGVKLAVYDPSGVRIAGEGPLHADGAVLSALHGRDVDRTGSGQLVSAVPIENDATVIAVMRAATSDAAMQWRIHRAWLLMGALAVVTIAIGMVVARRRARHVAAPLDELAAAAQRVGEGDFSVHFARAGIEELDRLAEVLEHSTQRLEELLVRERTFSRNASHQLRTPLAALRVQLEGALLQGTDDDETLLEAIVQIDRLEATIEDLLSLARGAGVATRLDVDALLGDIARTWGPPLAAAGRNLEMRVDEGLPDVRAEQGAIRQILDVLVSNALEHGAGDVGVRARRVGDGLALDVADEGPGTSAASLRQVQHREPASVHKGGHKGIGMSIAYALAETQGARIVLDHDGPRPIFSVVLAGSARPTPRVQPDDEQPEEPRARPASSF